MSIYYGEKFRDGYDVIIGCNDVIKFMDGLPNDMIQLIVTSPPYNIGKEYEICLSFGDYLDWQKGIIKKCCDILLPNGSICWQVGNYVRNGEIFPLDMYLYPFFKEFGMSLRNRLIWRFGHGLHAKKRLSGRYEVILWFTKGDEYIFNLDEIRIPQKYPAKKAYKGKNKGKLSCNPLGKNPSDVWDIIKKDWSNGIWEIPNVKSNHPEKTIHPAQFPIELVERLVLALTNEGDMIFDPFVGVASSIVAAVLHNRRGIGVDNKKKYTDIAHQRINNAFTGNIKKRELGKPIYKPK